jgi:RimJ/RimL family protein N-acetyltransferase
MEDRSRFSDLLGAEVPSTWPPELYDDDARRWTLRGLQNEEPGLITWYILAKREQQKSLLIGTAGFKGKPKNDIAEIGYSLVPEWQGQGLGTEAVFSLTLFAFRDLKLQIVCAHTLPELIPSQRVLEKNGFVLRGAPSEEGAIRYEINHDEWERVLESQEKI